MRLLTFPVLAAALLSGCAQAPGIGMASRPLAFHDTRLQYALVAGEDATLKQEFGMKLPPSWAERTVAGIALPFTAATEAAFFPFFHGIKTWAPGQDQQSPSFRPPPPAKQP